MPVAKPMAPKSTGTTSAGKSANASTRAITADTPNELIAWRSLEGADVDNSGIVSFEPRPGGRGTIVRVEIEYAPPGGTAGALVAKLFNAAPEQQVYDDLHRMKQLLETGEVTRSDAVPKGLGPVRQHAAQGETR